MANKDNFAATLNDHIVRKLTNPMNHDCIYPQLGAGMESVFYGRVCDALRQPIINQIQAGITAVKWKL